MSRIGKMPITIPAGVEVTMKNREVTVKGKKGTLTQHIDDSIKVEIDGANIQLSRDTDNKRQRAMHGLYRALIANMIEGVSKGYKIQQELSGVGFRATNQGQLLDMVLGYSHHIVFQLPSEITITTKAERGQLPTIILESHDKQLLGQVAAKIRSLRPPEPYKGKGIKFTGEILRRKAGKSAAKK